jgi:class 3 adenylate cyclase
MSSTRRLAAIMFTDIAGYTALMQTDEPRAIAIRQRHREVFERQHTAYRGQIVQYYGDGTLSVFDSAVDAVACAVAMQREFQAEPVVPLRIGLHTGDILITETEVIGDGVNLASRVESMAVPGAVLVSESVFDQIKNQPEFKGTSLGLFTFKNVVKPIEVFAIVNEGLQVPNPKNLEGKFLKRTSAEQTWLQRLPIWAKYAGGLVLFLLLAPFIYAPLINLFEAEASSRTIEFTDASGQTVVQEIIPREERREVYLGHFEVSKSDSALEWAGYGLPHALIFDLDQNPYCNTHFEEQKFETALSAQLSAAVAQGTDWLLRGSVQREAAGFSAQVALHRVPSGQLEETFTVKAASLLPLVDSISQALRPALGLTPEQWSATPDLPLSEVLTRVPAAYESYAKAIYDASRRQNPNYLYLMERAVQLDSTFAWAAFTYASVLYYYQRRGEQVRRYLDLALAQIDRMPELYSVYARQLNYKVKGENEKALQLLQLMTQLEPDNTTHWVQLITEAFTQNQYQVSLEAIARSRALQQDQNSTMILEAKSLLLLGRASEGLAVIDAYLRDHPEDEPGMLLKGQILLALHRLPEAKQLFQQGSLLFDNTTPFEDMLAHCTYAEAHAPMTEEEVAPFLGQYWVSNLTQFQFTLSWVIDQLSFQAPSQARFLLYPLTDSTFGTVHSIRAEFGRDEQGNVTYMRVDQGFNRGTLLATPVKEAVATLFEAFRDNDFDRAEALIEPALAAAPQDSFIMLMAQHLSYRREPAFLKQKEQYARLGGIYAGKGYEFRITVRDRNLFYEQLNNTQGLDPFQLYPFKPGHFFILENVRFYLQFEADALSFHYFGKGVKLEAERISDLP